MISLQKAFELGFAASGEGWNGEMLVDFAHDADWLACRNESLATMVPPDLTSDDLTQRLQGALVDWRDCYPPHGPDISRYTKSQAACLLKVLARAGLMLTPKE